MDIRIRPVRAEEIRRFLETTEATFGHEAVEEELSRDAQLIEPERTLCAFDDDAMVGTAAAFRFSLTIPGNEVPATAVTMVGVLPSH